MNWTQVEGKWDQLKGKVRSQWGKLTEDDVQALHGKREQLVGKVIERYGVLREEAEKQVDLWLARINASN